MPFAFAARHATALIAATAALGTALGATPADLRAQHEGHGAASTGPAAAVRRLGRIVFLNSGAPAAQAPFLEGIALLHNFHYPEAAADFRRAQAADPTFALPYWGEALSYSAVLWGYEALDKSRATLARLGPTPAARLARARTPDERAFGALVEAFYADAPLPARARAAADAGRSWAAAAAPGAEEPLAFAALAVMWQGYTMNGPGADTVLAEAAGYAQRLFELNPRHPGAAHYLIHAWDRPATAARALAAARAYDGIAPDADHALHMPAHIYYQLGMWPEMAHSNERAWPASRRPGAHGQPGLGDAHSLEWLQYAYLQQGRRAEARALVDTARRLYPRGRFDFAANPDEAHAAAYLAFRYGADTGDWSLWPVTVEPAGARADEVTGPAGAPASLRAQSMGLIRAYQEAVGALLARGDTTPARELGLRLNAHVASAGASGRAWGMRGAMVQGLVAQLDGLVAERRGDHRGAIAAYTRAAALAPGGGPSIPSTLGNRELLAAAQAASGDPRAAVITYDSALTAFPNRSSLLLGAARARAAAGDAAGSARAYAALRANWARADADLPALAEVARAIGSTGGMDAALSPRTWTDAQWVRAALLPLPAAMRDGAGVVRRGADRDVALRPSRNGYACLAAVPGDTIFDMRCYPQAYLAALEHARALRRTGMPADTVMARLDADVRAGRVPLPAAPAAGYRMLGPLRAYDVSTGRAGPEISAWQSLHVPFRTAAEMGLPAEQRGTYPFLMASGSWWAHVMIVHDSAAAAP